MPLNDRIGHRGVGVGTANDAELVALSQRGDLEAFNALAASCDAGLYRFVRRTVGNAEDARDLCQEALLKAYVNIQRLRDPQKFRAWLHHIALNLCRDWHRSPRSRLAAERYEEGQGDEARYAAASREHESPAARAERADLADILARFLGELSWEQRTAILLKEYEGFSSQEIAEITGVPPTTVRTRIFYGLKHVRRLMRREGLTPESLRGGGR